MIGLEVRGWRQLVLKYLPLDILVLKVNLVGVLKELVLPFVRSENNKHNIEFGVV